MTELHKSFSSEVFVLGKGWTEKKHVSKGDEILVYDEHHQDVRWGTIHKRLSYEYDGDEVYRVSSIDKGIGYVVTEYCPIPLRPGEDGAITSWAAIACSFVDHPIYVPIFAQAKPLSSPSFVEVDLEGLSGYNGQVHSLELDAPMYLCRQGDTIFGSMSTGKEEMP